MPLFDTEEGLALASGMSAGASGAPSPLVHALAGAVGAVVAMTLLYPLDQVRAILQVLHRTVVEIWVQDLQLQPSECASRTLQLNTG